MSDLEVGPALPATQTLRGAASAALRASRAACRAYHGKEYTQADAWNYYVRTRDRVIMHPDTRAVLEKALVIMRDEGEAAAFAWLRQLLKRTKGTDYTAEELGLSHDPLQ